MNQVGSDSMSGGEKGGGRGGGGWWGGGGEILSNGRAGFSGNGMGAWKVPGEHISELGPRMAAVRGISHCYQRPTYEDWPYSVFTMAHGRSKEECDAVLDGVGSDADAFTITV